MCRVPRNVVDLIKMPAGECGRGALLELMKFNKRCLQTPRGRRTLFSGDHTLAILSMPTAPSFRPSQLHATWVIDCWVVNRKNSRGRKAEKLGAYGTKARLSPSASTLGKSARPGAFVHEVRARLTSCGVEVKAAAPGAEFHLRLFDLNSSGGGTSKSRDSVVRDTVES